MRQLGIICGLGLIGLIFVGCEQLGEGQKMFKKSCQLQVKDLRCEYRTNPLGIDSKQPRLSWIITSERRSQEQKAYQILVAGSKEKLLAGKADLWDSGKVESDKTNQVVYKGKPLQSRMQCYWMVRVWGRKGKASPWSEAALWTMGLLKKSEWQGKWIGYDEPRRKLEAKDSLDLAGTSWIWYPEENPAAQAAVGKVCFRRVFEIPTDRKIKKASCIVSADNSYKCFINQQKVQEGNNFKTAERFDVIKYLHTGRNVLAVKADNAGKSANPAGLIAILEVQFTQGDPLLIRTDGQWLAAQNIKGSDWQKQEFDVSAWKPAKILGKLGIEPWGNKVKVVSTEILLPPVRYLRKGFSLTKPVKQALVYVTALGLYELHLNGQRVGNDYFSPGWTDFNTRIYYQTYDVTGMVKQGDNVIGSLLADGWYSGYIGWGHRRDHYGKNARLLAQLEVEYQDGSREKIVTDGSWRASTGPLLEADFLMGESYNACKENPGWDKAKFNAKSWKKVDITKSVAAKMQAYPGVPVQIFQEIKPIKITEPKKGTYVFDMGTNFAGFARLKAKGEKGQKIVLRFAERLNPDGTIYTTNLRGARTTDTYVCRGGGVEQWHPRFTFHGFQYVEVTGFPGKCDKDAITGLELTSATPVVGNFHCSDEMANTLYHNICQTQRANFIELPTDCPQRDERLGWMGDAQIYVRTATYNTDVAAFFTKWLVDVTDAQLDDGAFTDVSPLLEGLGGGTAAWGDAGVICPWTIYQVYGDKRILRKNYQAMADWIEYCKGTTKDLLRPAKGYGDWLSIKADTPKEVLSTAYFANSTHLVAKAAKVIGKNEDALKYSKLYEQIKKAFNKAYVDEKGRIKGNTQTVYVLALAFDLLPKDKRAHAKNYLVEDIKQRGWHLSTGFVGTKDLMQVLTAIGRTDVAYRLFQNKTFPSWGFSIQHGATSIWERWDGWTPEKGFQNPGMNSFAHYSFGAVGEWMFKTVGGIDTKGPGYKHIIIHPRPGGNLTSAQVSYNSIEGMIATDWQVNGDIMNLKVTIPANTTATVYLPVVDDKAKITESGKPADSSCGVTCLGMEKDNRVFKIGSGCYEFVVEGVKTIPMVK